MKMITSVLLTAALANFLALADDIKTSSVSASPNAAAKAKALSADEHAQYAGLIRAEVEAGAQLTLLNALAEEYGKRAADAKQVVTTEKAKWDAELAQDLRARSAALLAQLNECTRKRLGFEADHGALPAPAAALGALEEAKALSPDELAYVMKLDERLLKLRQELAQLDEAGKGLYAQLQTNATAEAVANVSAALEVNTKQARQLEWTQGDLELRKLQFRAMRK